MGDFIRADASHITNLVKRVGAGGQVLSQPFGEQRGVEAARIMRTGVKGVERQFVDQTEYRLNTSTPWERRKPFGIRRAGKAMYGSGKYKSAWLGGAGAITAITPVSVDIGVRRGIFPQVVPHQAGRSGSTFTVKPKQRSRGGKDWKMRFLLGLTYGVWISRKRIEQGLTIPRRRVSISSAVRSAVAKMIKRETQGRFRGLKLATKAT